MTKRKKHGTLKACRDCSYLEIFALLIERYQNFIIDYKKKLN